MRKGLPDVLIIGAGVYGLACARACARRGMRVVVAEAAAPGAGASGGPVGALAPHPPHPWSPRKAAQLEALLGAAAWWAEVAAEGGGDPGYARVGRAIPLADGAARSRAEAAAVAARLHWGEAARWDVIDTGAPAGWIAPSAAPAGVAVETLSARIVPRQAIAALAAAAEAAGAEIRARWRALSLAPGAVTFDRGAVSAGAVVLAAGAAGAALAPGLPWSGVKGQAALLDAAAPAGAPLVTAEGLYVVPRPDGVAVGSTAEPGWTEAGTTDARLDALIARARGLCPALRDAAVRVRWAGLRPRAGRPEPMVGPVPGLERVFVATGGFRTGFATAPAVAEAVAALVAGGPATPPPGASVAEHVAAVARRGSNMSADRTGRAPDAVDAG